MSSYNHPCARHWTPSVMTRAIRENRGTSDFFSLVISADLRGCIYLTLQLPLDLMYQGMVPVTETHSVSLSRIPSFAAASYSRFLRRNPFFSNLCRSQMFRMPPALMPMPN